MQLRYYQRAAIDAAYKYLNENDGNPVIVIPTGGGKTPLLAQVCSDVVATAGRVLVVSHVKELLLQQQAALQEICPDVEVGLYSAGLNSRDTTQPVIVAGVQSIYQRATELGSFSVVIVDEAHLIPLAGEGMYRQLLEELSVINPLVRVIGLTATPYRLKDGLICQPEHFLNEICYEVGVNELIDGGFLSELRSKAGTEKPDLSAVHVRGGEYRLDELEEAFNDDDLLVGRACAEIVNLTADRKSVLIFCSGVQHAMNVAHNVKNFAAKECGFICGETDSDERAATIEKFKSGELKYLSNVNVLTTGFDAPNVDCVVLLRATLSPGLYVQMCGRGFRLFRNRWNNKTDCLILDYGDNIKRHGAIDAIVNTERKEGDGEAPIKECPNCNELIASGCKECPECGHAFPPPKGEARHKSKASDKKILSKQEPAYDDETFEVIGVSYNVHTKRGADEDAPKTLRVTYSVRLGLEVSEWICVEHTGWVRGKAADWWEQRTDLTMPRTAAEAVEIADAGHLQKPFTITVRTKADERWPSVISAAMSEPLTVDVNDSDEVPF